MRYENIINDIDHCQCRAQEIVIVLDRCSTVPPVTFLRKSFRPVSNIEWLPGFPWALADNCRAKLLRLASTRRRVCRVKVSPQLPKVRICGKAALIRTFELSYLLTLF